MEAIRLHDYGGPDDDENIAGNTQWLRDGIESRKAKLIDRQRFQMLFVLFHRTIDAVDHHRVVSEEPSVELQLLDQCARFVGIYAEHCLQGEVTEAPPVVVDVDGTPVELKPTKFRDAQFRMFDAPFLATIVRDSQALERLDLFDFDAVFLSDKVGFRYLREFLALFQHFRRTNEFDADLAARAADVADDAEEIVPEFIIDFSHHIYLNQPLIDAMQALATNDGDGFQAAMHEACIRHQNYWGRDQALNPGDPKLRREPRGWWSLNGTAIAALAHDNGITLDFESDYLPRHFVTGSPDSSR